MIPLVINSFRTDLESRNENVVSMALHTICNIGGREMAETLLNEVEQLAISSASSDFVKKKSVMCLLRLYNRFPELFQGDVWVGRFNALIQEKNQAVLGTYILLYTFAAKQEPETFKVCQKAIVKLLSHRVNIKRRDNYVYYDIPNPWYTIKLMRFLQCYPMPTDSAVAKQLVETLGALMNNTDGYKPTTNQSKNAFNAVLLEAISLGFHLKK